MGVKWAFILFSLQLWHLAMPNEIPDVFGPSNELGKCVSSCKNFPIKIGNKLYLVESSSQVNWHQAVDNCRKWGGYLLNIESSTEMDLIVAIMPSPRFWVSSNCLGKDRTFISIATGVAMPFNRWKAGQPDNKAGNEYCVEVASGGLNDEVCSTKLSYVCQANLL